MNVLKASTKKLAATEQAAANALLEAEAALAGAVALLDSKVPGWRANWTMAQTLDDLRKFNVRYRGQASLQL